MIKELEMLAFWAKEKEIEALKKAKQFRGGEGYVYWDAKAQAFSQIWERIVFNGKSVPDGTITPEEYNKANDEWSKKVANRNY